jgi:von Willebrand factor A domain-containing protein 7
MPRACRVLLPSVLAAVFWGLPTDLVAFDPGIHEDITEEVLRAQGFDDDSADEVGDSNFYTDTFEATSADAHADNNQLGPASARLRAKIQQIGTALDACRRREALDSLGEALHTVQDVFSHSNAVDNGHAVDLLNMVNGTAACSLPNFAPGGLVTGYFSAFGWATGNQCRGMPAGSCCHRDLNKDNREALNGARHNDARDAAEGATGQYLGFVETDIRNRFPGDRGTQLIKMLKRKQRTVMFVIDDTGSMGNDIAGVKAAANQFLDQLVASDEAPTLGLVSYKDNVTNRGLTCNIDTLRAQINSLFASGGGDCPEAMNSALLSAIRTFPTGRGDVLLRGGRILLATDASAGDPGLGPVVQDEAFVRGISIDAILTGDCVAEDGFAPTSLGGGPESLGDVPALNEPDAPSLGGPVVKSHTGDPLTSPSARTYLRAITEQTGGVLFNVSRLEVDDVVPTLLELSSPENTLALTRRVSPVPGTPLVIDVPVDDTFTGKITFMVTSSTAAGLPSFSLRRPNGSLVVPTDPDATRRLLSSVASFVMQAPAPGTWQVILEGGAPAVLRVFGATPLRFNGLRLLVPGAVLPRPEIDLATLDGQPVPGQGLVAEARLTRAPLEGDLSLRRSDGTLLQDLAATPLEGGRRFRAPLTVPGESFLIELTGRTAAGHAFVRQYPVPVLPRPVGIRATPDVSVTPAGTSAPIEVTITNASAATATYGLSATVTQPWPIFGPGSFTIPAGQSLTFTVTVDVPAGTPEGVRDDINLRVQDVAVLTARNSATFAVVAAPPNLAPDCSGAFAGPAALWPPNHDFAPISIEGVSDPDGDALSLLVTAITQDEAVDAPGSGNTAPDGTGVGTPSASVRAERTGGGDGRVYAIRFSADDGRGGTCEGTVRVGVPKSSHGTAVDSGQNYDSTAVP